MLLLAGSNDSLICCGTVVVSMLIGGFIATRWANAAKAQRAARERADKAGERGRYNRIKVSEAQARGQALALCELCGGTGTWQGQPEALQDCPRCLGLGIVGEVATATRRCARCRQPLDDGTAAFCPNCGLEVPDD